MEEIKTIINDYKHFFYGIVGGIIIVFFDNDKVNFRTGLKLFVFGVLNDFTRRALVGFQGGGHIDIMNENQLMVASISLSILGYFLLLYITDKSNRDKIIDGVVSKIFKK